jgi:hypothetical protein
MAEPSYTIALPALDGTNPLGFLAALGALITLRTAGETHAQLHWKYHGAWQPVISSLSAVEPIALCDLLAGELRGSDVSQEAEAYREETQAAFEAASQALKKRRELLKKEKPARERRQQIIEDEIVPLERHREAARHAWLKSLANAIPRRELALGKRIDCAEAEYREHALAFCAAGDHKSRDTLDMMAAFGSDACLREKSDALDPTPFQFITGSGHQFFLETVRQLMAKASGPRVHQALFERWVYQDDGLSMRWDPIDDRRYALMDRDPTASDNKSRTVWMANLLAYRGLALFPSAPCTRHLGVTAWTASEEGATFTWPIWDCAACPDVIRSILQLPGLATGKLNATSLEARGMTVVFSAARIKVGSGANFKWNFSPASAIWVTSRSCTGSHTDQLPVPGRG